LNILFIEDKLLFTADSIPLKNDIPNYDNYIELMDSLEEIKTNKEYNILLTSWTPALTDPSEIDKIIFEGEQYIKTIGIVHGLDRARDIIKDISERYMKGDILEDE